MLQKLVLDYLGPYEDYRTVRSESPINDIWNTIVRFGDINYLSKKWLNQDQQNYIYVSTSIKQAYEYFKASKSLSMNTRPLLLYYSFLNLTKSILFIQNDTKPSFYHGLGKEDISHELKTSKDILGFSAEVNNGVFYELAKLNGWNVSKKERITLEDFFANAIELCSDYIDYFQKPVNYLCPIIKGRSNGELIVTFVGASLKKLNIDKEKIKESFSEKCGFILVEEKDDLVFKKIISEDDANYKDFYTNAKNELSDKVSFSVFNDRRYYFNYAPENRKIPNANAYFGIMFILSSIVRYKPEHIYNIIDNKDISVSWFLNRVCDISERVYPNLLINCLYRQNIKYASEFI